MWRFVLYLSAVLSLSLISSGCKKNQKLPDSSLIRIQIEKEPATLDWHKATDVASRIIILNVMEPLLDYEFSNGSPQIKPALLGSIRPNDRSDVWTFTLRSNVYWSDGQPLTVQHIIDSFERLLSPQTGAFFSYYFYVIKNAKAYNQKQINDFSKVGIKQLGSNKIQFTLEQPAVYFPQLLALMTAMPIRKDLIEKFGIEWTHPEHFVGLGPYTLKEQEYGVSLTLVSNPKYYSAKPKIDQIQFLTINEPSTAIQLFDTGGLDALTTIPLQDIRSLKLRKEYKQVNDFAIEYLGINTRVKPFDQKKFRQILHQSIQRSTLTDLFASGFIPTRVFMPTTLFSYKTLNEKTTAKRHFDIRSFSKDDLVLTYYTDENQKRMAEHLQAQFKDHLGTHFELQSMDWKTYLGQINTNPPGLYRIGWMAIYPDPVMFLELLSSDSHFNTGGWSNKTYDRLVQRIRSEHDETQRRKLIESALKIINDEVPVIPLYTGSRQYMIAPWVKDFPLNPMNRLRFHRVANIGN